MCDYLGSEMLQVFFDGMFGIKLRSWMEAVRPRKKHHRKEKQTKNNAALTGSKVTIKERPDNKIPCNELKDPKRDLLDDNGPRGEDQPHQGSTVSNSRYSANNLSSPESAYSTGYSTDGTSPGAPPEYLINTYKHEVSCQKLGPVLNSVQVPNSHKNAMSTTLVETSSQPISNHASGHNTPILKTRTMGEPKAMPAQNADIFTGPASPGLGITSPRQRNRIRTNPWVPGSVPSPSPVKHCSNKENLATKTMKESPRPRRYQSPVVTKCRSLSSSSCSSLSGASLHLLEPPRHSGSDDDDCTLNEMMGKYDESYVYEKETDILSDSDPTDCETDIDTGQDGGDEDDLYEGELDFIDNGSYLECDPRPDRNTGHCSYYNYDAQRKRSSRRRTTRRSSKQSSERKKRSSSNKKRQSKQTERDVIITHLDGSKSAGATPISVRRAGHSPVSRLALDECLKKRSNSVSFYRDQRSNSVNFYRDHLSSIDRRDKEADIKYRELIFEADKILRTMKTNGLSPRRLPGPSNKRVELLRSTECSKPDVFVKNRPGINEDTNSFPKIPSSSYNSPRFSPKKSHITNFIINNSPVLVKKEWDMQNRAFKSPVMVRRRNEDNNQHVQKGILHREKNTNTVRGSPRHKRKFGRFRIVDSSSESEDGVDSRSGDCVIGCPQSEPVRRKVYFACSTNIHKQHGDKKTVAFKLTKEVNENQSSTENLRQQVLLNTIVNLKKNLENQSASLKQVYSSSQNVYI